MEDFKFQLEFLVLVEFLLAMQVELGVLLVHDHLAHLLVEGFLSELVPQVEVVLPELVHKVEEVPLWVVVLLWAVVLQWVVVLLWVVVLQVEEVPLEVVVFQVEVLLDQQLDLQPDYRPDPSPDLSFIHTQITSEITKWGHRDRQLMMLWTNPLTIGVSDGF